MIIRILGEGQFQIADEHYDRLNELDAAVEKAIESKDEDAFGPAFVALLDAVHQHGETLPDEELVESTLVLPPSDASLDDVAQLLGDDGLIPG